MGSSTFDIFSKLAKHLGGRNPTCLRFCRAVNNLRSAFTSTVNNSSLGLSEILLKIYYFENLTFFKLNCSVPNTFFQSLIIEKVVYISNVDAFSPWFFALLGEAFLFGGLFHFYTKRGVCKYKMHVWLVESSIRHNQINRRIWSLLRCTLLRSSFYCFRKEWTRV